MRARCWAALWLVCACNEAPTADFVGEREQDHPLAGLFTPGSEIGVDPNFSLPDAGMDAGSGLSGAELAAVEESIRQAGAEDRCVPLAARAGTPGTLDFEFTSATYDGFYAPENCGAVWIEDTDGQYIATPLVWAQLRLRNLFVWNARRCSEDVPDAIASATLPDHTSPHLGAWDGTDREGNVVPDGTYVLNIEVTEDEFNYGRRSETEFQWGGPAATLQPPDTESVLGLKLEYTPAAEPTP